MTTNLTVDGTVHITGAQTNKKSIVADGEIQTLQNNKPKLSSHTHKTISMDTGQGTNAGKKNESEKPS